MEATRPDFSGSAPSIFTLHAVIEDFDVLLVGASINPIQTDAGNGAQNDETVAGKNS